MNSLGDANSKAEAPLSTSGHREFADGFFVTTTNPKTLLFHGAFLPQFVDPTNPALPQLLILASSFLAVVAILDSCWHYLQQGSVSCLQEADHANSSIEYQDRY